MLTPVLYVIRHGRTSFNQKGLFRGEADIPLVEEGIQDAEVVAKELADIRPSFIVTSDKKRAVQTARILSKDDDDPIPLLTDQLRAWNLGNFSGQPKSKENLKLLEKYIDNPDLQVPGGETLNDFRDRILPVLAECFEQATRDGPGFVVAHSSVVHEIGSQVFGSHKSLVVKPGGIITIGFDGSGGITAERIFKPLRDLNTASVS